MAQSKGSSAIIIVLLVVLIGVVAAWYFTNQNDETPAAIEPVQEQVETSAVPALPANYGMDGTVFDKKINPVLGERALGNPEAPVQIREFFSLTCNHCASFHSNQFQVLKEKYIDTGKVYFIFEEFPLNGPALYGSMIARCMPEGRYYDFISLLLKEQTNWAFGGDFKSALKQNASLAGMSEEEFDACYENKDIQQAIAENIKESSEVWNIRSTPTFIFNNGRKILSGADSIEAFETVIAGLSNIEVSDDQKRVWSEMANENMEEDHDHDHDDDDHDHGDEEMMDGETTEDKE